MLTHLVANHVSNRNVGASRECILISVAIGKIIITGSLHILVQPDHLVPESVITFTRVRNLYSKHENRKGLYSCGLNMR